MERDSEREQAFIESLLASYKGKGGQDTSNLQSAAKQMAQATGDRVIVAQGDGRVIADSDDQLVGQMLPWPLPAQKPFGGIAGVTTEIPVTAPFPGADVTMNMPFVVRWTTAARDAAGRRASFYAFAGDHYSLTTAGARHFCVGCHPGHSGMPHAQHRHAEQLGG